MRKFRALISVKAAASSRLVRLALFLFAFPGLFSLFAALNPVSAQAAVPVRFTYQGNLRQSGFLVNGQKNMKFRVFDSSGPAAVSLWESSTTAVDISTGIFRVTLEPVINDWQSGNLWLELEIEGKTMSPREELTSSPFAINSAMLSGKHYVTSLTAPGSPLNGDLWYDQSANVVKFWNGTQWLTATSSGGAPANHAASHAGGGTDAITSLGSHTVTGSITVQSSVSASGFYGDGSGLYNINASSITFGALSGDVIGKGVIVSTHIADGSILGVDIASGTITKDKLNQSGCGTGQILLWDGTAWTCSNAGGAGLESDPWSIHMSTGNTLQSATFYVSSGTVNDFNVNNSLQDMGTAVLHGAPGQQGLSVGANGNVAIGVAGTSSARLEVRGEVTQPNSFAVGIGATPQVVVSTSGAVGIGTQNPNAPLQVVGPTTTGQFITIFMSGAQRAAFIRNK